jgi:hypothetical protein
MSIQRRAGDASAIIGEVLESIPPDHGACVFQTHAMNQFSAESPDRCMQQIAAAGRERPVAFVPRHDQLTLEVYSAGEKRRLLLAETDPHGRWIKWLHDSGEACWMP